MAGNISNCSKANTAALPCCNTVLEIYLKQRRKQIKHDKKMLDITRKGLDVPFSHIQ